MKLIGIINGWAEAPECWRNFFVPPVRIRREAEAGAPLVRYGKPGTVCTACGMGFGGTTGFDRHRHAGLRQS